MCSFVGLRQGKSVAYLSRYNGRAEVAERQVTGKLRIIYLTWKCRNWFQEMWPALKAHHDSPTPVGLSPHHILFGRDPLGGGLPFSGDGIAMDDKEFCARQETTAQQIRQQFQKEHAQRAKTALAFTANKFWVGDPFWVPRPRPLGTHRTRTWFTPGEEVHRIGEYTYRIKVEPREFRWRHESEIRAAEPEVCGKHPSLDYTAHEVDSHCDYAK